MSADLKLFNFSNCILCVSFVLTENQNEYYLSYLMLVNESNQIYRLRFVYAHIMFFFFLLFVGLLIENMTHNVALETVE